MKKVIFLIFGTIILTGCINSTNTLSQPEGKVIVDGKSYMMMQRDYEWIEADVEIKTHSSASVSELADNFKTLEVRKGDTLKFEIDKNPSSITVNKLNEDTTNDIVELKENTITAPTKKGYYIYELHTIWNEGKQTFVFDMNVE